MDLLADLGGASHTPHPPGYGPAHKINHLLSNILKYSDPVAVPQSVTNFKQEMHIYCSSCNSCTIAWVHTDRNSPVLYYTRCILFILNKYEGATALWIIAKQDAITQFYEHFCNRECLNVYRTFSLDIHAKPELKNNQYLSLIANILVNIQ